MPVLIALYFLICTLLSFVDFDFDDDMHRPGAAWHSIRWQTLYMSEDQMKVYFDDITMFADEYGRARVVRDLGDVVGLAGLDKDDIHDIANSLRKRKGIKEVDYPWQGPISFTYITYIRPLIFLALDTNAPQYEFGNKIRMKIGA